MKLSLSNPYKTSQTGKMVWLRGNLHTHTTRSDGSRAPQDVISLYSEKGYGFLCLSDHDKLADFSNIKNCGMVLISGNEISAHGIHILDVGAREHIKPDFDRQKVIDAINKKSGFAILNHPNWGSHYNHCTFEKLQSLKNYTGIEIYNGDIITDEGCPDATDKWDRLLTSGRMVWGFGADDFHHPTHLARAWNVARVPAGRQNAKGVLNALKSGSFYVSTGVELTEISVNGTKIKIESKNAKGFEIIGDHSQVFSYVKGRSAEFDVRVLPATYVRILAYGNPREYAWTQPFQIKGRSEFMHKALIAKPVLKALKTRNDHTSIDDPLWNKATPEKFRFIGKMAGKPAVSTEIRAIATTKELIFRVVCSEPCMNRLKMEEADKSTQLWSDDCVELFIQPAITTQDYFQIIANAKGNSVIIHSSNTKSCPAISCTVSRENDRWIAMISIKLEGLQLNNKEIGFHAARNRKAGVSEHHFWKWTGAKNNRTECFGRLSLKV